MSIIYEKTYIYNCSFEFKVKVKFSKEKEESYFSEFWGTKLTI